MWYSVLVSAPCRKRGMMVQKQGMKSLRNPDVVQYSPYSCTCINLAEISPKSILHLVDYSTYTQKEATFNFISLKLMRSKSLWHLKFLRMSSLFFNFWRCSAISSSVASVLQCFFGWKVLQLNFGSLVGLYFFCVLSSSGSKSEPVTKSMSFIFDDYFPIFKYNTHPKIRKQLSPSILPDWGPRRHKSMATILFDILNQLDMINIKLLQDYLTAIQSESPGIVNNIFLANNENHILISTKERDSESSVLSTLLNDSLYIIRLNLASEDDKHPLEIIAESDNEITLIYNIEDHFIYGVSVRRDKINLGRQLAIKSLNEIREQFKQVMSWAEVDAE